ncbi:hypothetical protein, partial [Micromonospora sp. ATA51]|uniref:hypothetical protein n=1 Tax=Micromonospora sp. ATA51 TaxID=2806098 RepID=UPI001A4761A2
MVAGVTGAWCASDAVAGDAAYAADPAPAGTVTGAVDDLLRDLLSPVLATPPADPSGAAVPSTGTGGA